MSDSTPVNSQITDAAKAQIIDNLTKINIKVFGDAPSQADGNLFVKAAQAIDNAAHNATGNEPPSDLTIQATTTDGINTLIPLDQAAPGPGSAPPSPPAPS